MDVSKIFEIIIQNNIEPLLYSYKFIKIGRGAYYYKTGDNVWRIVPFFGNSYKPVYATLNVTVCVGFISLAKFLRPFSLFDNESVKYPCAMASDISNLYNKEVFGWPIDENSNVLELGDEIYNAIKEYGMSYFEQYGTIDKAIVAWEKGETYNLGSRVDYYLSAAYWLRGERVRAVEYIEKSIIEYEVHDTLHFWRNYNEAENRREFIKFLKQKEDLTSNM